MYHLYDFVLFTDFVDDNMYILALYVFKKYIHILIYILNDFGREKNVGEKITSFVATSVHAEKVGITVANIIPCFRIFKG